MNNLVPVDLEFFLHCHYKTEPHPQADAPSYQSAKNKLLKARIIAETPEGCEKRYTTTERGWKWLQMLLSTPYPTQQWSDPREDQ